MALKREEFRKTAKFKFNLLWCQHCKAMQKANETVVDCYYNPLSEEGEFAFCASSTDAVDTILETHNAVIRGIKEGLEAYDFHDPYWMGTGFDKWWREFWQKYIGGK